MNPNKLSLPQKLLSTQHRLSRLRQNLSQFPTQSAEFSATIEQLSLLRSEFQDIVSILSQSNDNLISVLNHEFLTPLTLLQGSLQLLTAGKLASGSEKTQFLLKLAFKQTNYLLCLVRELLAYHYLKSGQLRFFLQPCPAALLLKPATQLLPLKGKQFGVILSVKPAGISVSAEPRYTILLLSHLLSNALKFSPTPSIVTLTATLIESTGSQSQPQSKAIQPSFNHDAFPSSLWIDSSLSPFLSSPSSFVLFQVKDRGIGIPPDQLAKIFDCFYQVDRSDSRPYNGMGLGLALAHQIIQQQGGQLWAESTWGAGSTFSFTLPVSPTSLPWWIEVRTNHPHCTYYFGPFDNAFEAQALQPGYLEDLRQEQAQIRLVQIKQCQPQQLTICAEFH